MTNLLDGILSQPPALVLLIAGALVFAEDALFFGFVVPGETAAVLAGVSTAVGTVPLPWALVTVVVAAVVGDTVGYAVGTRYLSSVRSARWLDRHRSRVDAAEALLLRRGGIAVLLGRFTAFFRAVMPALAGAVSMPYRTFLLWNAVGGVVWGAGFVLLGRVAGASYQVLQRQVGREVQYALLGVVVLVAAAWWARRHRRPRAHDDDSTQTV